MLITCSLANMKNYDADYKYFIVINPKSVKVKGLRHRPDLAPTRELYSWVQEHKHEDNWFEHYKEVFLEDMKTRAGLINALNDIENKAKTRDVLLVCFCSDVNLCHRGIIADEMIRRGIKVERN